jgi:hypothetical protein
MKYEYPTLSRQRAKPTKRVSRLLVGGPWDGKTVEVPTTTMVFTAHGQTGHYYLGTWVPQGDTNA